MEASMCGQSSSFTRKSMKALLIVFVSAAGLAALGTASPAHAWYDAWGRWHPNHHYGYYHRHYGYYGYYHRPRVYYHTPAYYPHW
jgi:hypothetical protein